MPTNQRVSMLILELQGPVLSAFRSRSIAKKWQPDANVVLFRERLLSIFADREVKYTTKLITMSFDSSSLVADLITFGKLARYSAFRSALDGNAFVYDILREKLNQAVPDALVLAATRFQLHLFRDRGF